MMMMTTDARIDRGIATTQTSKKQQEIQTPTRSDTIKHHIQNAFTCPQRRLVPQSENLTMSASKSVFSESEFENQHCILRYKREVDHDRCGEESNGERENYYYFHRYYDSPSMKYRQAFADTLIFNEKPSVSELREWWESQSFQDQNEKDHSNARELKTQNRSRESINASPLSKKIIKNNNLPSLYQHEEGKSKDKIKIECSTIEEPSSNLFSSTNCLDSSSFLFRKHEIKLTCKDCQSCILIKASHCCEVERDAYKEQLHKHHHDAHNTKDSIQVIL